MNGSRKCGIYTQWIQLEYITLNEVSQSQKHKDHMFLSYMEDRSERKTHTQK
jgi:hypothetical protein